MAFTCMYGSVCVCELACKPTIQDPSMHARSGHACGRLVAEFRATLYCIVCVCVCVVCVQPPSNPPYVFQGVPREEQLEMPEALDRTLQRLVRVRSTHTHTHTHTHTTSTLSSATETLLCVLCTRK